MDVLKQITVRTSTFFCIVVYAFNNLIVTFTFGCHSYIRHLEVMSLLQISEQRVWTSKNRSITMCDKLIIKQAKVYEDFTQASFFMSLITALVFTNDIFRFYSIDDQIFKF